MVSIKIRQILVFEVHVSREKRIDLNALDEELAILARRYRHDEIQYDIYADGQLWLDRLNPVAARNVLETFNRKLVAS